MFVFKWINVRRGNGLGGEVGYMGTSGNRDCQLASRSVLKDFTDDAWTTSTGCLFGPNAENALVKVGATFPLVGRIGGLHWQR